VAVTRKEFITQAALKIAGASGVYAALDPVPDVAARETANQMAARYVRQAAEALADELERVQGAFEGASHE
jgi:hypothetical protein